MIEPREAFAGADAILATPGLDGIYIGLNNLCLDYGRPPSSETNETEVASVIAELARRARSAGKLAGIFCSSGDGAKQRITRSFGMVTPGNDVSFLVPGSKQALATALGDSLGVTSKADIDRRLSSVAGSRPAAGNAQEKPVAED